MNINWLCTIILPVVLYGCETWSLILREKRRLRVFENMVLRRIFGPKRNEVTGEWRRLHNRERYALYSSPYNLRVIKARRLRWVSHVARTGERRGAYRVLVEKSEGRRTIGNPRLHGRIILKWIFEKWVGGRMGWIDPAQDRDRWRALVNVVMKLRVP
jgi:hypothetical protein